MKQDDRKLNLFTNQIAHGDGSVMMPFYVLATAQGFWPSPRFIRKTIRRWQKKNWARQGCLRLWTPCFEEMIGLTTLVWNGDVNGFKPPQTSPPASVAFGRYVTDYTHRTQWVALNTQDLTDIVYNPLRKSSIVDHGVMDILRLYTLPSIEVAEEEL